MRLEADDIFKSCASVIADNDKQDEVFSEETESRYSDAGCDKPVMWLTRGLRKTSYRMIPSVFREGAGDEHSIFTEVLRTHFDKEFKGLTDLEILCKMQHYGVPTRLMDFTAVPLIASFFALSSLDNKFPKLNPDDLPKVVAVPVLKSELADFYSDRVAYLSSIPRLSFEEQKQLFCKALEDLGVQAAVYKMDFGDYGNEYRLQCRNFFRLAVPEFVSTVDSLSSKTENSSGTEPEIANDVIMGICKALEARLNGFDVKNEFNTIFESKNSLALCIGLKEKITAESIIFYDDPDHMSMHLRIVVEGGKLVVKEGEGKDRDFVVSIFRIRKEDDFACRI